MTVLSLIVDDNESHGWIKKKAKRKVEEILAREVEIIDLTADIVDLTTGVESPRKKVKRTKPFLATVAIELYPATSEETQDPDETDNEEELSSKEENMTNALSLLKGMFNVCDAEFEIAESSGYGLVAKTTDRIKITNSHILYDKQTKTGEIETGINYNLNYKVVLSY